MFHEQKSQFLYNRNFITVEMVYNLEGNHLSGRLQASPSAVHLEKCEFTKLAIGKKYNE